MKNIADKEQAIKKNVDQAKDDLMVQFNEIIDGAERLLKEAAESADSKTSELREQLTDKIKGMRESMGEHAKPICKKSKEAFEVTDEYVKKHPWAAVGIAAATVFVVSHFCRRR